MDRASPNPALGHVTTWYSTLIGCPGRNGPVAAALNEAGMHRSIRLTLAPLFLPALLVACLGLSSPTRGPVTGARPEPTPFGSLTAGERRPIVITTDMGMDDLLALYV